MVTNEDGDYTPDIAHSYMLFLVKIPSALALHLVLSPQVNNGLKIMKYAGQQYQMFIGSGSYVSYLLGLNAVITALLAELVNIYMLAYQHTV